MSIDRLKLSVLKEAGTAEQKSMVERVSPILDNHHLLLGTSPALLWNFRSLACTHHRSHSSHVVELAVTLLFCNAIAMEALPIFLDRLVPSVVAIIMSVTFVLIFGEVVPQAVCTANPLQVRSLS
jgi:hypothetical protein